MMEKSFGMFFFLKQTKSKEDGTRCVYLRITVNGKSRELSIKRLWHRDSWDSKAGRATSNREDAKTLNSYLELLNSKVYQAKKMLLEEDKTITAESIKSILLGKSDDRKMILELFQHHNKPYTYHQVQALP